MVKTLKLKCILLNNNGSKKNYQWILNKSVLNWIIEVMVFCYCFLPLLDSPFSKTTSGSGRTLHAVTLSSVDTLQKQVPALRSVKMLAKPAIASSWPGRNWTPDRTMWRPCGGRGRLDRWAVQETLGSLGAELRKDSAKGIASTYIQ